METMNQAIQVGSEEVGVVAVAVEEVDGQVGEVEDMAMVAMMLLTLWLCRVIRWAFDHKYPGSSMHGIDHQFILLPCCPSLNLTVVNIRWV